MMDLTHPIARPFNTEAFRPRAPDDNSLEELIDTLGTHNCHNKAISNYVKLVEICQFFVCSLFGFHNRILLNTLFSGNLL